MTPQCFSNKMLLAQKRKLATKLILYILLWSSLITLFITSFQLYLDYTRDLDLVEEQFKLIETSHVPILTKSIWTMDREKIQLQLQGILQLPYIHYIHLQSGEDAVVVGEESAEYVLTRHFPMQYDDRGQQYEVGVLQLTADLGEIYQHLFDKLLVILMSQALKTFLVSALIFFIVQQLLIQYLKTIVGYVQTVNLNSLSIPLQLTAKTDQNVPEELQELTNGINQMRKSLFHETEKINALTKTFEKFVPQQFLARIASEGLENIQLGKAESEYITILFSDIRSFTTLSESITPQELLNFLNGYLSRINRPIHAHHGFIDKFIGDAIMALFDHPQATDNAEGAVRAAIGMQEALQEYNQHRHKTGYPPIAVGIGVHSGPVVIGTIGSEDRMDSTVLGDAVNLASRIEGLTKLYNAQIIISSETHQLLQDDSFLLWRELDTVTVKGKHEPVSILEIFNTNPASVLEKKQNSLAPFEEGLAQYRKRQWPEALHLFQKCLEIYPDDLVSQKYIERCTLFDKNPPPPEWQGSWEWHEK